jgi:hypothetical protein
MGLIHDKLLQYARRREALADLPRLCVQGLHGLFFPMFVTLKRWDPQEKALGSGCQCTGSHTRPSFFHTENHLFVTF